MSYNLTNFTSASNIGMQMYHLDRLSGGVLSLSILVAIGLIMFLGMKRYDKDFKECFLASSTLTTVIGIIMFAFQLITWQPLGICFILVIISLLIYKFSD